MMAKKAKVKTEAACPQCGAEKRPNTLFCGARLGDGPMTIGAVPEPDGREEPDENAQAALDDLAERLKIEPVDEDKLAKAAAERKKARVASRQPKRFRWEQPGDGGSRLVILLAVLIFVVAAAVVMLTVIWK